jgi:hypothetical protein
MLARLARTPEEQRLHSEAVMKKGGGRAWQAHRDGGALQARKAAGRASAGMSGRGGARRATIMGRTFFRQ